MKQKAKLKKKIRISNQFWAAFSLKSFAIFVGFLWYERMMKTSFKTFLGLGVKNFKINIEAYTFYTLKCNIVAGAGLFLLM